MVLKFVREYRVLHSMLRNLMALFIKSIFLAQPYMKKIQSVAYVCSFSSDPGERVSCDHVDLTDPFY